MDYNSKIYIAGHTGLAGSAILKALQRKGYKNLITIKHKDLDLRNQPAVQNFFEDKKPEYVFLAAAKVGGIEANNRFRADFIYDNLMIESNVIHSSYITGVKKLLFLGSTCVYPRDCNIPVKEEYLLTGSLEYTNEPYAVAKIAGLKMCESYNIQYNTDFICVMPSNLYGFNDNFDLDTAHVLPALLRKIHLAKLLEEGDLSMISRDLETRPLKFYNNSISSASFIDILSHYGISVSDRNISVNIWGTGKPLREFLWADDLADACIFLMEKISFRDLVKDRKEVRNLHINIGTGKDISISELTHLIASATGFKGKIGFDNSKPDGTYRKLSDVSLIRSLGWKHSVNIDQGIKMLYEWYLGTI